MRRLVIVAVALALASCTGKKPKKRATETPAPSAGTPAVPTEAEPADDAPCQLDPVPTRYPAAERVVAIGDVHGDLSATRAALRAAGAIDDADRWIGGSLVLVQTGDILDRGDDEQAIIDLFESLKAQAKRAGGAVHVLNGNHELMNAAGDLRYVTPGGFRDFEDVRGLDTSSLAMVPERRRARVAAFRPGGPYARILADHNTAVIVGDTVFVHGGVTPKYAAYGLARLNAEIRCWLAGASKPPVHLADSDGPTWTRDYSMGPERCQDLERALATLKAKRMVVGHTPQMPRGANSACGGKVWRIDVGMASHYGGVIEVLELRGEKARVLRGRR